MPYERCVMSFIKQVMSRYRVTAGDIVNFQAFKDKNKKPDTKRVMDDFLSLVADALTKAGWKVGDPKPGLLENGAQNDGNRISWGRV